MLEGSDGGSGSGSGNGSGSGAGETIDDDIDGDIEESTIIQVYYVPVFKHKTCNYLYNGWDVFGEIFPWYQFRSISISWRGIKVIC